MALSSSTWPRLRPVDTIGISVLSAEHDQLCRQLAGRDGDRFAGVDWRAAPSGAVAIAGAAAFLECSVESEVTAGDHVIVVLRIVDWDHAPSVAPLVFHASGFRQLQPSAAEAEGA
jgi:flavin reductase (DIM6/NTAB) family NADH-FMN oxidoreductase RutF